MSMETGKRLMEGKRDGLVGHSKRVRYNVNGITNENNKKKKRCVERISHRVPSVPMALQDLFLSCRDVFKGLGTVPSPCDVQKLCCILDNMTEEDVGLSKNLQFFKATGVVKGTPRVTYTTIYQCDKFSLCIFFLPATAVIPLHNHPEMTVFTKLLLGTMHIKSYDWVDPTNSDASPPTSQRKLAKLKANSIYTAPCNAAVLYPTTGGNIHAFTAIRPCAVLDVIGPPYSKEDGRDCAYYKDYAYSDFLNEGEKMVKVEDETRYGWLEEIDMPENLKMDGIEYLGPQVSSI